MFEQYITHKDPKIRGLVKKVNRLLEKGEFKHAAGFVQKEREELSRMIKAPVRPITTNAQYRAEIELDKRIEEYQSIIYPLELAVTKKYYRSLRERREKTHRKLLWLYVAVIVAYMLLQIFG